MTTLACAVMFVGLLAYDAAAHFGGWYGNVDVLMGPMLVATLGAFIVAFVADLKDSSW
jgi:hypothetical protein